MESDGLFQFMAKVAMTSVESQNEQTQSGVENNDRTENSPKLESSSALVADAPADSNADVDAWNLDISKERLQKIWDHLDNDQTGLITVDKLVEAFHLCDRMVSRQEVDNIVSRMIDTDMDGRVSMNDLVAFLKQRKRDTHEYLKQVFAKWDKNGDGTIGLNELRIMMTTEGERLTEEEFQLAVARMDVDKDGLINFEDFKASLLS